MKRKLMFGITVLFMIIAVIFTACPSDDDSSSGGSSSSSSGGDGPNAGPPLDYNKGGDPNDPTYKDDDTTLSITVPQDENDPVVYYSWYMNKANNNTTGTLIPEASGPDKSEYKPDTTIEGKTYYYVVITFRSGKKITSQTREVWVIKVSDNQRVASLPKITRQPEGAVYSKGAAADDLTVEAEIPETEGGTLSYQWFQNTASNNTNGTAIADTNKPNYKPSTANVGKIYYYVEVTNTIPDNQDGGKKSRTTKSNPVLIEVKNFLNAPVPVIKTQPVDALYEVFDPAVPLTVVLEPIADPLIAELTKTTYKWFKIEKQAYGGLEITTEPSYTPPTDENKTLWYYYCEITNTMDTAPAGYILVGTTASVKSVIVSVGVGVKPVNIGGLSVQPKTYNGDKAATITGAATGLPTGTGITLHWGDAFFEQSNVGTGIKVEFSDWYLQGDAETVKGYKLNMPPLTGTINPADGADVAAEPELDNTITLNPTSFKITVKAVALANTATEEQLAQQTVEYTVATTNNAAMASLTGWQDGPALNVQYNASGYYIYARSKKSVSNNFTAGKNYKVSDSKIYTAAGSPTSTGALTGTPTRDSIIVTPITLDRPEYGQSVQYAVSEGSSALTNQAQIDALAWQDGTTITGLKGDTDYFIYARAKKNENYDFGAYKVSGKITTLPAQVTFVTDAAGVIIAPIPVPKVGGSFQKLNISSIEDISARKPGYTFDYWFEDSDRKIVYDFDTLVDKSITLYARWVSDSEKTALGQKDMVLIKSGAFMMGTNGNTSVEIQHKVILNAFWMSKYEVTQEKWRSVMDVNPSQFTTADGTEDSNKLPVDNVSWYNALVFCNRLSIAEGLTPAYKIKGSTYTANWGSVPTDNNLDDWSNVEIVEGSNGYRLPTEAQWEYACRAGTTTDYNLPPNGTNTWGGASTSIGWNTDNSNKKTHQVGLKAANAWGLYDMHGNVAEWCWDKWAVYTSAAQVNPLGPATSTTVPGNSGNFSTGFERVVRGGGFSHAASLLRSAYRTPVNGYGTYINYYGVCVYFFQYFRYDYVGLRLVRPLSSE